MKILRVELDNIKSYEEGTVAFADGVNIIYGQNGAGKSTILEAIAFTLFDALPYDQGDFVRRGESNGKVTVVFESPRDGQTYRVEREAGVSRCQVYPGASKHSLEDSVNGVKNWLCEQLGVANVKLLSSLFENAIGVPQGNFTAAFQLTPGNRRKVFDPLLQLDEYEDAWNHLKAVRRHCEDEIKTLDERIAWIRDERLAGLNQEQAQLAGDVSDGEDELKGVEKMVQRLEAERDRLQAAREKLDQIAQQHQRAQSDVQTLRQQCWEAEDALKRAQVARDIVERTRAGYEAYTAAQQRAQVLDQRRNKRDGLHRQRSEAATQHKLSEQEVNNLQQQLAEVEAAESEMESLAPHVAEQEQLEDEQVQVRQRVSDLEQTTKQHKQEQERLERLQERREKAADELEQRWENDEQIATLAREIEEADDAVKALAAERIGLEQQQVQLENRLAALDSAEGTLCPVCQEPMSAERSQELFEKYRQELSDVNQKLEDVVATIDDKTQALGKKMDAQKRLIMAQGSLASESRLQELDDDIKEQIGKVQALVEQEESLKYAPDTLHEIEEALEALGNPRSRQNSLQEQVNKKAKFVADLTIAQRQMGRYKRQLAEIDEQLEALAGLDDELQALQAEQAQCQEAHSQYLSNKNEASEVEARQQKHEQVASQLQERAEEEKQLAQALADAEAQYDAGQHDAVKAEYETQRTEQTRLETILDSHRTRLSHVEKEINDLERKIRAKEGERKALEQTLSTSSYIREAIRDAGKEVATILTERVSQEAADIFSSIAGDYTIRLRWTQDYGIVVEQGGHERAFHQLSGGEQMAAAVAVRLALLRQMSNVDVAFFDEPTANLDDERRHSLADQITAIQDQGFRQIFVISHDDAFEDTAHHVVHLEKAKGSSRLLS